MDILDNIEKSIDETHSTSKRPADQRFSESSKRKRDELDRPGHSRQKDPSRAFASDPPREAGPLSDQGMFEKRHAENRYQQGPPYGQPEVKYEESHQGAYQVRSRDEDLRRDEYRGGRDVFCGEYGNHGDRGGGRGGFERGRGSYRGGDRGGDKETFGGDRRDDRESYGDRRGDQGHRAGYGCDGGRRRFGGNQRGSFRGGGCGDYGGGQRDFKQENKPEYGNRGGYEGQQFQQSGSATELEVSMNALKIHAERQFVYRFHFDMFITRPDRPDGSNSGPKDICITPKNDQAAIQKERCVFNVLYTLITREPDTFGKNRYGTVFDGGYTLYTVSEELYQVAKGVKKEWTFTKDEVAYIFPEKVSGYLKNFKEFKVTLTYTNKLYISGPKFNRSDPSRESQKFFDVITSSLAHEGNYLNYGQRSYDSHARPQNIGQAKEIRKGLEKTTKTIGNEFIVLQVSSTATAFHSDLPVLKYCEELLNRRSEREAVECLSKDKGACRQSAAALKNIFIECTHLPKGKKRYFSLRDIEWDSTAANTRFQTKDGNEITVQEYYRQTYSKTIKYPDLPLAVEKIGNRKCYYPLEYCRVTQGHRIGTAHLGKQAEEVYKLARTLPHEQQSSAKMELEKMQLIHGGNPYLEAFQIKLDSQFFKIMAKIIAAPMKEGGGHQTIPAQGRDRLQTFFHPAVVPSTHKVFVVVLDRCLGEREADDFYRRLSSEAKNKGMTVPQSATIREARSEGNLERLFKDCKEDKAAIIIFLTRDKLDNVHHIIKKLEEQSGVQTQHVCCQTVQKFTGGGGAQTVENVLRKFNPKLGGVNEAIIAPSSDAASRDLLKNKMFVGLELSHPAAQSLFDRQFGVDVKNPTVIGLCHSLEIPEKVTGRFWFQNPREYSIKHLERFFGMSLDVHKKNVKTFPQDIIIYRAGASERDQDKVAVEIQAIQAALASRGLNARIVLLLCVTHSGTTLTPTNVDTSRQLKPIEANVPSGTSISDSENEFLIKSQNSNIGTSKMLRVIVHLNEPAIPVEDLRKIAHWHAFAHSASTCPTSKPHVLYGAVELAKRGANHYKQDAGGYDDTRSMCSGGSSRQDLHPGESGAEYKVRKEAEADDYYLKKSNEAQHTFEHQFWA